MFSKSFVILIVCSFVYGIPLESSTDDMAKYFPSSNRIVGGINAPEGYAPHMAALVYGTHYIGLICGGSIVSPTLILTAAHCIDMFIFNGELASSFHGVVGTNRWDSPSNAVHFSGCHIHPEWDPRTIKNDIALTFLNKPLTWSSLVRPIKLNFNRIENEEPSYVTGWGLLGTWPVNMLPSYLQLLHVNTISYQKCLDGIKAASIPGGFVHPLDDRIEICTYHSPGHGMCNGDSGSALVSTNTYTQIGIVSWGFPCARGAPDMFVRIDAFKNFIEMHW